MRRFLLLVAVLSLAFAPAPFPRPARRGPATMAGAWDVEWGFYNVLLDLRPDGSARFKYVSVEGSWDGPWRHDGGERLTLTLLIHQRPTDYEMTFETSGRDAAEGKVRQGPSWELPMKLTRARLR